MKLRLVLELEHFSYVFIYSLCIYSSIYFLTRILNFFHLFIIPGHKIQFPWRFCKSLDTEIKIKRKHRHHYHHHHQLYRSISCKPVYHRTLLLLPLVFWISIILFNSQFYVSKKRNIDFFRLILALLSIQLFIILFVYPVFFFLWSSCHTLLHFFLIRYCIFFTFVFRKVF